MCLHFITLLISVPTLTFLDQYLYQYKPLNKAWLAFYHCVLCLIIVNYAKSKLEKCIILKNLKILLSY